MKWTKLEDKEPTEKDLPFITYGMKLSNWPNAPTFIKEMEVWEDTDWFFELTSEDRSEWIWWKKLDFPKKR